MNATRIRVYGIEMQAAVLFRDYFNNFLSVKNFAEHYGFTEEQAREVIAVGRREHEANVAKAKGRA